MSNTNTEIVTTAYEKLQKALTQSNTVLPKLEEAVEKGNLDNYATVSQLEDITNDYAKKTEINELASNKANQVDLDTTNVNVSKNTTDIATQTARIDTFTSLQEGSTTGDAELIDGRVGADGVTYKNIGGAIRKQYEKNYNGINNLTRLIHNKNIPNFKSVSFDTSYGDGYRPSNTSNGAFWFDIDNTYDEIEFYAKITDPNGYKITCIMFLFDADNNIVGNTNGYKLGVANAGISGEKEFNPVVDFESIGVDFVKASIRLVVSSKGNVTSETKALQLNEYYFYDLKDITHRVSDAEKEIESLKENDVVLESKINERINFRRNVNYDVPILTIIDDDGKLEFKDFANMMMDKGVTCSLAVISSKIGTNEYLSLNDLFNLKNAGFDIVSHTNTHNPAYFGTNYPSNYGNLALVDDSVYIDEFKKSRNFLIKYGFNHSTIVFPWGHYPEGFDVHLNNPDPDDDRVCGGLDQRERLTELAKQVGYKYGVNSVGGICVNGVIDEMFVPREVVYDSKGLDYYKSLIDVTVKGGHWLVLMTHAWDSANTKEFLGQIIDYAKTTSIEIKTFKDAIDIKRNAVSIGYYNDLAHSLKIAPNGKLR